LQACQFQEPPGSGGFFAYAREIIFREQKNDFFGMQLVHLRDFEVILAVNNCRDEMRKGIDLIEWNELFAGCSPG